MTIMEYTPVSSDATTLPSDNDTEREKGEIRAFSGERTAAAAT